MCHFADRWVIVDMYIKADFILTSDISTMGEDVSKFYKIIEKLM
jgi:hypothetical protein